MALNQDLARRRWVWQEISDLFLDEEVTEGTLRNIARVAAECGYTAEELDAIYRHEVAPAVAFNVFDMTGAWGYFDTLWLENRITNRSLLGYLFNRYLIAPLPVFWLRHHWRRVIALLTDEHERVMRERNEQGDRWTPIYSKPAPVYHWGPPHSS